MIFLVYIEYNSSIDCALWFLKSPDNWQTVDPRTWHKSSGRKAVRITLFRATTLRACLGHVSRNDRAPTSLLYYYSLVITHYTYSIVWDGVVRSLSTATRDNHLHHTYVWVPSDGTGRNWPLSTSPSPYTYIMFYD